MKTNSVRMMGLVVAGMLAMAMYVRAEEGGGAPKAEKVTVTGTVKATGTVAEKENVKWLTVESCEKVELKE
jgi:hypothetical protein